MVLTSVNLKAADYMKWTNFKDIVTEPPLTKGFTEEEIMAFVKREKFQHNPLPCHSQNAEQLVAHITKVSPTSIEYEK